MIHFTRVTFGGGGHTILTFIMRRFFKLVTAPVWRI